MKIVNIFTCLVLLYMGSVFDAFGVEPSVRQLPFAMPDQASLRAEKPKVFAHYFTQFPRSFDNQPAAEDYYSLGYLVPEGENGKFRGQGGFLRQRPQHRSPQVGLKWQEADCLWEVATAAASGIDGFCLNLLDSDRAGAHWRRSLAIIAAAESVPGFSIVLMPDVTSSFKDPAEVVAAMVELSKSPAIYRMPDGRVVVAPYCPQIHPDAWWQEVTSGCAAQGLRIALFPVLQSIEKHFDRFAKQSVGMSEWGLRTVATATDRPPFAQQCHERGLLWMEPICPQDMRAKDLFLFEAANTRLFRGMWMRAIEKQADWVQLITWNDYSEASEIAPSSGTDWLFMDLTAWFSVRFKTGAWPKIIRDSGWLVHRTQRSELKPTAQTKPFFFRDAAAVDEVEAVLWLTAPADVMLTSGDQTRTQRMPAGLASLTVPLRLGTPTVRVTRSGALVLAGESRWPVVAAAPYQDLLYRATSVTGSER
jgi:hypothetical protein